MVADEAEHFLKVPCIGSADTEDSICLASNRVRLSNFWNGAYHLPHPLRRHPTFAVDLDKCLDRPAQCRRLDVGRETLDDTALAEPINPPFGGCGRQPDVMPKHRKALPTVVGQPRKDLVIYFVKTQYSLLALIEHTI